MQTGGESTPRGRGCRTPGNGLPLQGHILTSSPALGAGSWICRVAAAVSRERRSFSSSPPAEGGPWGSAGHTLLGIHFLLCSVQGGFELPALRALLCHCWDKDLSRGDTFPGHCPHCWGTSCSCQADVQCSLGLHKGTFPPSGLKHRDSSSPAGWHRAAQGYFPSGYLCHIPPPSPSTEHKPCRDEGRTTPPKTLLSSAHQEPPHLAMLPLGSCFTFLPPHYLLFPLPGGKKKKKIQKGKNSPNLYLQTACCLLTHRKAEGKRQGAARKDQPSFAEGL